MSSNTAEIKNYLHKLIVETDDKNMLSKVKDYFNKLKSEQTDWWDSLSEQEKRSISIGIQQLEDGEGIPHDVVKGKAGKILGHQ